MDLLRPTSGDYEPSFHSKSALTNCRSRRAGDEMQSKLSFGSPSETWPYVCCVVSPRYAPLSPANERTSRTNFVHFLNWVRYTGRRVSHLPRHRVQKMQKRPFGRVIRNMAICKVCSCRSCPRCTPPLSPAGDLRGRVVHFPELGPVCNPVSYFLRHRLQQKLHAMLRCDYMQYRESIHAAKFRGMSRYGQCSVVYMKRWS